MLFKTEILPYKCTKDGNLLYLSAIHVHVYFATEFNFLEVYQILELQENQVAKGFNFH